MGFHLSKRYKNNTLGGLLINLVLAGGILVLLCVLYFYVWLPNTTHHGETITVPNIEGKSLAEVKEFLARHDLRYEISDSTYSDDHPPLTVLKQVPVAGSRVKQNRKIYISLNRVTPPTVPMPDLIDGSLINAEALLKGSELKRGRIHLVRGPFLNVVKEMRVGGRTISPKTLLPKGTVVDLVVEDGGSDTLPTPDLIGLSFEDAKFVILGSNLSVGKVNLIDGDTTGKNHIILRQNPVAQQNIRVGNVVDVWIGEPGSTAGDPEDNVPDDDQLEEGDDQ